MDIKTSYDKIPFEILKRIENANIFYTEEYWRYATEIKGALVIYIFNNNGIWVLELYKKYLFKYIQIQSDVFFWNETSEEYFLDKALNAVKEKFNPDWIGPSAVTAALKEAPQGAIAIPWGTYRISLEDALENIWDHMHSKHRNVIRRAEKDSVYLKQGIELLDDYLAIDEQTWGRSGRSPIPRSHYESILRVMKENSKIYIVYKDGIAQGGAIFLYNKHTCYYMYGASSNEPALGAMNWLHWQVIKEMKNIGVRYYDFVGCRIKEDKNSKYHGIQRFKERFGGELLIGNMFKCIYKPFKYQIYQYIKTIRNKGNFQKDIIEQELYKWCKETKIEGKNDRCSDSNIQ